MKTLRPLPPDHQLRRWQYLAVRRFHALNQCNFLMTATPGSGKTLVALTIVHQLLLEGSIERVVIVAPTDHLKRQWAEAAARLGIDLDPKWANASGRESSDYFGVAVTYHQVGFAPDLYDLNCRKKTLVIFDEIHHAGDNLDWGIKLRHAFRNAAYRLSLSGTPFRSDDHPIPFVSYVAGKSRADFSYGYGAALADGVCRPIYFPTVEGNVAWIRPNGSEMDCSMLDELSRIKANERLRTALDAGGEWLREVLREADALLTKMRLEGHRDAGGLVIALDQFHARKIAELLKIITNEAPTIAISDEDDSSREIHKFAKTGNTKRWIVAVKMVSEGVDIPRLRVGVYATTITSELFFRQAVGRFVRMIEGLEEQSAALFLPYDARLVAHALAIKDEREHTLTEKILSEQRNRRNERNESSEIGEDGESGESGAAKEVQSVGEISSDYSGDTDAFDSNGERLSADGAEDHDTEHQNENPFDSLFQPGNQNGVPPHSAGFARDRKFIIPLSSSARMHETIFNGDQFTGEELSRAEYLSQQIGMKVSPAQVAALLKIALPHLSGAPTSVTPSVNQSFEESQSENAAANASFISNNSKTPAIPNTLNNPNRTPDSDESGLLLSDRKHKLRRESNALANRLAHLRNIKAEEVHRRWIVEQHGSKNNQATEAELRLKYAWLKAEIIRVQQKRFAPAQIKAENAPRKMNKG